MKRVPFSVALRHPVGDVSTRSGELLLGDAGWAEYSPLPSWTRAERALAEAGAIDSANNGFPPPVRDEVEVNALVPRVAPEVAAGLARASGCGSIKVKVGDAAGEARVRAVRDALPGARIRIDANGAWDIEEAERALRVFASLGVELAEDPVASMEDLAALRPRSPVPVAAESCVRTVADARRLAALDAADALVIKPQRIGGVRAALEAAAAVRVPVIASSALETSVGLAAVLAFACALPSVPYACGIGTALLLAGDVVREPLIPRDGRLRMRVPEVLEAGAHG